MSRFQKATKAQAKLRLALVGPTGSGKTYTALTLATNLGDRVALIDTENGSASKYSDRFEFDTLNLLEQAPRDYVDAINDAADAGYPVLVIDSLSHAWKAALKMVDKAAKRSQSNNTFTAWRDVTPEHDALVDALITYPGHLIVTMRAKTEYVIEKDERTGKSAPRKVGLAPVQRDGVEYEFDVVADMNGDNDLIVSKTRIPELAGEIINRPGADVAKKLKAWLEVGEAVVSATDAKALTERMNALPDDIRKDCKREFAEAFGKPNEVYQSRLADADTFLKGYEMAPQVEEAL